MKNVVLRTEKNTVYADLADPEKYYGVITSYGGVDSKAFISKAEGKFLVYLKSNITIGNCYGFYNSNLSDLISRLVKEDWPVVEFDTPQELFKWLSE